MLANGATLGYRTAASGEYTDLPGLKTIPDMGGNLERVNNTALTDAIQQYEIGIPDSGDMEYTFRYVNTSATDSYRVLRGLQAAKTLTYFKETDIDGTAYTYSGYCSVVRNGGGVNDAIEFTLQVALQSDISVTDPV